MKKIVIVCAVAILALLSVVLACGCQLLPVGGRIAFHSDRALPPPGIAASNIEIYVMAANGSHQRNLTHSAYPDWGPVWSPDGSRLAFQSEREGGIEIYVMDANGSNQRNLTRNPGPDRWPAWSP